MAGIRKKSGFTDCNIRSQSRFAGLGRNNILLSDSEGNHGLMTDKRGVGISQSRFADLEKRKQKSHFGIAKFAGKENHVLLVSKSVTFFWLGSQSRLTG